MTLDFSCMLLRLASVYGPYLRVLDLTRQLSVAMWIVLFRTQSGRRGCNNERYVRGVQLSSMMIMMMMMMMMMMWCVVWMGKCQHVTNARAHSWRLHLRIDLFPIPQGPLRVLSAARARTQVQLTLTGCLSSWVNFYNSGTLLRDKVIPTFFDNSCTVPKKRGSLSSRQAWCISDWMNF